MRCNINKIIFWFKGKNLKIKHINAIKYMFEESCKYDIDTYLLFITKLFQKVDDSLKYVPLPCNCFFYALNDINKTFSFTVNSSMNKLKARSNIVRSITNCKSHQIYAFINSYSLQQLYLKQ